MALPGVGHQAALGSHHAAPGVGGGCAPVGGVLPLGLAGESGVGPLGVGHGVGERDLDHRVVPASPRARRGADGSQRRGTLVSTAEWAAPADRYCPDGVAVTFAENMDRVAQGFEGLGALILVIGFLWSVGLAVAAWRLAASGRTGFVTLRQSFGAVLLLALEVLVAADLIRTVAVAPTLANVAVLGLIVLIRTVLSFSLEIEIDGAPPWRRALTSGATVAARASRAARDDGRVPRATGPEADQD